METNTAPDGAEEICASWFSIALSGKNNPVIAIGKISRGRVFKLKVPGTVGGGSPNHGKRLAQVRRGLYGVTLKWHAEPGDNDIPVRLFGGGVQDHGRNFWHDFEHTTLADISQIQLAIGVLAKRGGITERESPTLVGKSCDVMVWKLAAFVPS
jgi:hypothetical protein